MSVREVFQRRKVVLRSFCVRERSAFMAQGCAPLFFVRELRFMNRWFVPRSLFCPAGFSFNQITPVAARPRASLSLPRESDNARPGSPPGPRAGRQPSSGGCRPVPPAVRGGVRASTGPRVGLALPAPLGQGGGASAQPARCSRRNLGFRCPLVRMQEISLSRGPKGSLEPLRI